MGAKNLAFSNSYRLFFSDENPELQQFDDFLSTYSKNDLALIVLHNKQGHILQKDYAETIEWLTEQAWQLPFATRVDSISNFQYSYSEDDELFVENLIDNAADLEQAELDEKLDIALNEAVLRGNIIAKDGRTTAIVVTVNMPEDDLEANPKLAYEIRQLKAQVLEKHPELHVALSGVIMLNNAFSEASLNDMQSLVPLMYGLLIFMTIIVLRSFFAAFSALLVIITSSMIAMGMGGHLGIPLSPVSVSAPTIIMTLAIADSIHILVSMLSAYAKNANKQAAIIESIRVNFIPVTLTSLTTIVGFLTLNFSDAPPYWHLGNITAIGILAAWALSLTLLPALLNILPIKQPKAKKAQQFSALNTMADFVIKFKTPIVIVGIIISLALTYSSSHIELNDEFVKYFDKDIQFRQDADFLTENLSGLYNIEYTFKSGEAEGVSKVDYLQGIENFANWMRSQAEVKHVYSHSDIIKRLNRNMHNEDEDYYRIPDSREEAAQYLLLFEFSLPQGLDMQNRISLEKSETRLTVILDDITSVQLQDLNDRAYTWQLENNPHLQASRATGTAVMFSYISKRNVQSMLIGNFIAIAVIGFIMFLSLRSFSLGLISVLANAFPIIMMFGIWAILVGKVGMVASSVAASTLGIVVDDTVHFLSKYLRCIREEGKTPEEAIRHTFSTVGVAIISTTLILVSGFSILALSDFQLNQQSGTMSALTIGLALVFDLLVLPAILLLSYRKKKHAK